MFSERAGVHVHNRLGTMYTQRFGEHRHEALK